ncbi:MAG: hypothetical protein ACFB10_08245 [Salibacteraceae bacterium]
MKLTSTSLYLRKWKKPLWFSFSLLSALSMVLLLSAFQDKSLSPEVYWHWVEDTDNGLKTIQRTTDFEWSLQYRPAPYIALQELRTFAPHSRDFEEKVAELKGLDYYTLRIRSLQNKEVAATNAEGEDDFFARQHYLSSYFAEDLQLVDGQDTLPCALFHFERNYSLAPYNDVLLAFETQANAEGNKRLLINSPVLETEPLVLEITAEAIHNLPDLKL